MSTENREMEESHTQAEQRENEIHPRPSSDGLEYIETQQGDVENSEDNGRRERLDPKDLRVVDRRHGGVGCLA